MKKINTEMAFIPEELFGKSSGMLVSDFTDEIYIEIYYQSHYFLNEYGEAVPNFDNVYIYEYASIDACKYGISIFINNILYKNAIISADNATVIITPNTAVINNNEIVICCGEYLFCISIPELELVWSIIPDPVYCLGVYNHDNDYIIHGDSTVSRVNSKGEIIWKYKAQNTLVSETGVSHFELHKNHISVLDNNNKTIKLDYQGKFH